MTLDHYVSVGASGLKVSPFCLGAMTFGEELGFGCAGRAGSVASNANERTFRVLDALAAIAGKHQSSVARVAPAWLHSRSGVTAPILEARTVGQLTDNLASLTLALDEHDLNVLDAVSVPKLNFPAEFLTRTGAASYGGMSIDGHAYAVNPLFQQA